MGKSSLGKRYEDSYDSRNQGGSRNGILDWSKHSGNKVKFYKLKEGINKLDIIPYTISSSNHPLVKRGTLNIGDLDYTLDIWVHKSVGPAETDVVCLKKNYGKGCPLCDQAEVYKQAGKKEEFDAYKAKRRVFYNIRDVSKPEDGIQVLEQSHFKFEKELIEEAKTSVEGGGIVDFADPDEGMTVKFKGSPNSFGGRTSIEPKNFSFVDRSEKVGKLSKSAIGFDALLVLHTAAEMEEIMNGVEDDDDDDIPSRTSRATKDDDEEKEDEKPTRRNKDEDDDDEEDEKPRHSKPVEKDEDEDDKPKCPKGHRFGKDNDEFPDCDDCPMWKACARASK